MAIAAGATDLPVAWWKEPTKDQWLAWIAAWLGWTLDAFDFTIFLLITHGFCDAYADQHNGYRYKRCHCIVNQSGNEMQSVRFRLDEALVSEKIRFRIDDS